MRTSLSYGHLRTTARRRSKQFSTIELGGISVLVVLSLALVSLVSPGPSNSAPIEPAPSVKLTKATPSVKLTKAALSVKLTKVALAENPVQVLADPVTGELFVVEQPGRLRALSAAPGDAPAYDVSGSVSGGNEQGLLGAAFSRDGTWLYTNRTNRNGDTEITATPWSHGSADRSHSVLLLKVAQPYSNHNGGNLIVDGTGVLWIGLGDGGSAGDPGNRAQNLNVLLGKMLRILPTPGQARPYAIPAGNVPKGVGRPEIWGYGLRNPWRYSIDAATNTLWIGDVGQNRVEEIDAVSVKAVRPNFGWPRREGDTSYRGKAFRKGEAVEPVWTFTHDSGGCSVTGGVVYRGSAIPALRGMYVYSDFCDGTVRVLDDRFRSTSLGVSADQISSFGVDRHGEIYITSLDGPIYRLDVR